MTVDEEIRQAGSRLADAPVAVPDFDRLVRRRHRMRAVGMSGAMVLLVMVGVISLWPDAGSVGVETGVANGRHPATGPTIGLSRAGIWPGDERQFATAEETAQVFAEEVLGWEGADVILDAAEANGPTWLTVSRRDGRSFRALAAPTGGGWLFMQIGEGLSMSVDGVRTRVAVPRGPEGTVSLKWWALVDGEEKTGVHADLNAPLTLSGRAEEVETLLVVYLDDQDLALGVVGGDFFTEHVSDGVDGGDVPTYGLRLNDAELASEETLTARGTDVSLWTDENQQTYLSLTVRAGLADAYPKPTGFGPMTEDASFPGGKGRAWFGEGAGSDSRTMKMWWARADGDVWILTAHWYGPLEIDFAARRADLRSWALAIEPGSNAGSAAVYVLDEPTMQLLAFDKAGDLGSRARVWRYLDQEITLLAIEGSSAAGLSNLLDLGKPEPVTIAGHHGWMVRRTSPAGTIVGWQVNEPRAAWATLTIPAVLADETEEVLRALEQE